MTPDFERCFDCKIDRTFTRVKHVRHGWVYFCRACDDKHEAGRNWWAVGLKLHAEGVFDEVRIVNQLTARLRRMLSGGRQLSRMRQLGLDELAPLAGEDTAAVLRRLTEYETEHGSRVQGFGYEPEKRGPRQTALERRDSKAAASRKWRAMTKGLQLSAPSVEASVDKQTYEEWTRNEGL